MMNDWISARAAAFRPSSHADAAGQVSRELLAENLAVWYAFATMFAVFGVGIAGLVPLFPSFVDHRLLPFAAILLVISVVAFRSAPPPLGTKRNHVPIACVYVLPAIGLMVFRPESLIPMGTALFIGPFTAIRLRSRAQIGVHYALASVALFVPVVLGSVNASAQFGVATVVPAMWVLGFCVVIILEAAERSRLPSIRVSSSNGWFGATRSRASATAVRCRNSSRSSSGATAGPVARSPCWSSTSTGSRP